MENRKSFFITIYITYFIIVLSIIIYLAWLKDIIIIPECPIHKFTALYCPACGGTRAIIALARGDAVHSFLYNPIVIYTFFFSTLFLVIESVNILLKKEIILPWKIIIRAGLAVLVINWIIQNIFIILN